MAVLTRPEGSEPRDFVHSRRALAGMFFAGYALAAVSAEASPIVTDARGLEAHEVRIPLKDGTYLPAYMARPDAKGRFPVVIVVSEVFGVHEYIRDVCRRLAKLGYVAIAPAFFFRAGDPAPLTDFDEIRKIVETATNAQVMGDIDGVLDWLGEDQDWADRKRLAITGFCWGGAVAWMAAARFPEFKAAVAWYGRLAPPRPGEFLGSEKRQWPLDVVGELHAPVLGLYAGLDKGITAESIDQMRAELKADQKKGQLIVYPDAQHGFHADYRPTYNEADALDGWARMLAWFRDNGVPAGAKHGIF